MTHLPYIISFPVERSASDLFASLANEPNAYFFDSAPFGNHQRRFSHFGIRPTATFHTEDGFVTINGRVTIDDPIAALKRFENRFHRLPHDPYCPLYGLMVGYAGFEWGTAGMATPPPHDHGTIPDSWFGFYDTIAVVDHLENHGYIASLGLDSSGTPNATLARRRAHEFMERLEGQPAPRLLTTPSLTWADDRTNVIDVNILSRHLHTLDATSKLNIAQRFYAGISTSTWDLHRHLAAHQPTALGHYLNTGTFQVSTFSLSPTLQINGPHIACHPVLHSGSRPLSPIERHHTPTPTYDLRQMSADYRGLWKLCEFDSIEWNRPEANRDDRTIYWSSTIRAKRNAHVPLIDAIATLVPSVSMTGHPRQSALSSILSTEPVRRNIYSGGIGYISHRHEAQFNSVARAMVVRDRVAYMHSGTWVTPNDSNTLETLLAHARQRTIRTLNRMVADETGLHQQSTGSSEISRYQRL